MRTAVALALAGALAACTAPPSGQPSGGPERDATVWPVELMDRAAHTMTPVPAGGLLVAGGCEVDGCATATPTTYVVHADHAVRAADLNDPRDAHTATPLGDGRVLVTGGFTGEGAAPLTSAEVFDPVDGSWERVGRLDVGRGGHAAALLGDGRVLVAGGWVASGTRTATTEIFDPGTGEFTRGPRLPAAVDGLAATSLPDGSVLVVGGQLSSGVASDLAVTFGPSGRRASRVAPPGTPRFKHALLTLDSGVAVLVGGTSDDDRLLRSTEVFDQATRQFRPGPDLLSGRYKLAGSAIALPGGRVLVAGGGPGVELLDLARHSSRRIDQLGADWSSFSTVGVTDGHVVLLGGYDRDIQLTGTRRSVPLRSLSGRSRPGRASGCRRPRPRSRSRRRGRPRRGRSPRP